MTLDLYGHLFGDQLDEIADAMDAAPTAAQTAAQDHADFLRTDGQLIKLRPTSDNAVPQ